MIRGLATSPEELILPIQWDPTAVLVEVFSPQAYVNPFGERVKFPKVPERPSETLQLLVSGIVVKTGWSQRLLAKAVGTTHPTIGAILSGKPSTRLEGLVGRVRDASEVVDRVHMATGQSRDLTNWALTTPPEGSDKPALEFLRESNPQAAYLASLERLGPRRSPGTLVQSVWPAKAGTATRLVTEE